MVNSIDANVIASNSNFIRLNQILNRFNIFEATDMGRREIKHTKFLAYLLDPNESHGLGDSFLFSFLATLPDKEKIPILSLHTELCEVATEWRGSKDNKSKISKNKNYSLDIYLKIPKHGGSTDAPSFLNIFIENKINSTQRKNQLLDYTDLINGEVTATSHRNVKLFLTEQDEEPQDNSWIGISYVDNVASALNQLLEIKGEIVSKNIKQALLDYILLIGDNEKIDDDIENIINKIDNEIIEFIHNSSVASNEWQLNNLRVRFSKAWKYLFEYKTDPRLIILKSWNRLLKEKSKERVIIIDNNEYVFAIEKSTRSYLRFTVLSNDNREKLMDLAQGSQRKGIDSQRNIVFEIGLKNTFSKTGKILPKCLTWSILVLGPLNVEKGIRDDLVHFFSENKLGPSEGKNITPYVTRLMSPKQLINTQERSDVELKKAISETYFDWDSATANQNPSIKLTPSFEGIVKKLNDVLQNYFARQNNPLN